MTYRSNRKSASSDKYLRLTGLWPSKSNEALFTGRVKADDVEALIEKFQEAVDSEAPIVFSLWENDKKRNRKDPDFNLQCFVGDAEEKPRSRRESSRDDEDRKPGRKSRREEPEDADDEAIDEAEADDETENEDEEEAPRKKSARAKAPAKEAKKSKNDW